MSAAPGDESFSGSVYVFTGSGATWSEQQKLNALDGGPGEQFGQSVAVDGDTLVTGAFADETGAGSAEVFTRSGSTWTRQQKLIPANTTAGDFFGWSAAIEGDTIVVGAPVDDNIGTAYAFTRSGTVWTEQPLIAPSDGSDGDFFGTSVDIGGETIVVGAFQLFFGPLGPGAAYVFGPDNQSPVASAGPDQIIQCTGPNGAIVTLDGRGSFDPDNNPLTFSWSDSADFLSSADVFSLTQSLGTKTYTLTVDDGKGSQDTDKVSVKVRDTVAPAVTVTMNPNVLWPADRRMVDVRPEFRIADACDRTPKVKLISVKSNEKDQGLEAGDKPKDIQGVTIGQDDRSIQLRAERYSKGKGRVYTFTFEVTDASGNKKRLNAEVKVPLKKP